MSESEKSADQDSSTVKPGLVESFKILFAASRGYWLVNAANFGDGVAYFGFLTMMTLFMEHNVGFSTDWSHKSIAMFTGAVTLFMALGGGVVSDRLGVRRALTLCIALLVVGRILFVVTPSVGAWPWIGVTAWFSLFIMAAAEGIIQPALYAGIKEYTDARTRTLGYAFLYSIMNLGIVAGHFISPYVREYWARQVEGRDVLEEPTAGISGAFWFFIGITAIMLVINVVFFTHKVAKRDRTVVEQPVDRKDFNWSDYFRQLPILDVRFLFFIFILLPVRTLFAHQFLTLPGYVTRAFPGEVGAKFEWISGLNPLVIVIFVPLIAALTQKKRVVDMMIVGTSVSALSSFMLVGEPNTTLLLAYVIVFALGEAAWSSRFLEYVADISPVNRVGIYMGIAGIPWWLAKTVTGFYSGNLLDRFVPAEGVQSPGTLWLIYGLTALVTPVGLLAARRWLLGGVRNDGVG